MSPVPKQRRPAARQSATISNQLRAIIRGRGLTPYAVSQAADVSPSVVTRFVNGERGLTSDSLDLICEALGLELRETRRGRSTPGARKVITPNPSAE